MNRVKALLLRSLWTDPNYEVEQMDCPEITIEGISEAQHLTLLNEAETAGAKFDGEKASISGCDFTWNYDAPSQTLHIVCVKKPFYASCDAVETRIRALVAKSQGGI